MPFLQSKFLCSWFSCEVITQEQSLGQELQCTDKTWVSAEKVNSNSAVIYILMGLSVFSLIYIKPKYALQIKKTQTLKSSTEQTRGQSVGHYQKEPWEKRQGKPPLSRNDQWEICIEPVMGFVSSKCIQQTQVAFPLLTCMHSSTVIKQLQVKSSYKVTLLRLSQKASSDYN